MRQVLVNILYFATFFGNVLQYSISDFLHLFRVNSLSDQLIKSIQRDVLTVCILIIN
jgi:hypothetical protein